MSDGNGRLAELKAARAQLAADREARATLTAEQQIAIEERALADDQALARAESEIGALDREIKSVDTDMGVVIVKRAHPAVYRRFSAKMTRSASGGLDEARELASACRVHPSAEELDRIFERMPHVAVQCASKIIELAGARSEEVNAK